MKKEIFVRTPYNYDMNKAGEESAIHCRDKTLTQQQFKAESDINTIVERFKLTGSVPQLEQLPSYADFTGIFDYQSAMNAVVAARETFMELPAKLRARFHNDPQEFVAFCDDADNKPEAERLGLLATPPHSGRAHAQPGASCEAADPQKGGEDPRPQRGVTLTKGQWAQLHELEYTVPPEREPHETTIAKAREQTPQRRKVPETNRTNKGGQHGPPTRRLATLASQKRATGDALLLPNNGLPGSAW